MTDAPRATRGSGLLEGFLSRKRAAMALRLLTDTDRSESRVLDIGCGSHPYFLLGCGFAKRHGVDFDAVTMLAVFEHIDPPVLMPLLSEVRRVLRPDGRLVLTTPAGMNLWVTADA